MKKMDAGLSAVIRGERLEAKIEEMSEVLLLAKQAILWLAEPRGTTPVARADIVEKIDAVLSGSRRNPGDTYCKHCGLWRDETACRADPYINAEPRDYCPVALKAINAAIAEGQVGMCQSCGRQFVDGDTCPRGGCPMGGDV